MTTITTINDEATGHTAAKQRVSGRSGALDLSGRLVRTFQEKPPGDGVWINGEFFVLSPKAIDYIAGDESILEREVMERLAQENQLSAFLHKGFWQPLDTLRDKLSLEELWSTGKAPWRKW